MNKNIPNKKWYDSNIKLILVFFLFWPVAIYGFYKRKNNDVTSAITVNDKIDNSNLDKSEIKKSSANYFLKGLLYYFFCFVFFIIVFTIFIIIPEDKIGLTFLIIHVVSFLLGFSFYKRNKRLKEIPKDRSIVRLVLRYIKFSVLFIISLIMSLLIVLFIEYVVDSLNVTSSFKEKKLENVVEDLSKEQLWYKNKNTIESDIAKLENEWDDLLESSWPFGKTDKINEIKKELDILRCKLPIEPIGQGKLKYQGRYIYAKDNPDFASMKTFKICSEEIFHILEKNNDWYLIRFCFEEGYVHSQQIKLLDYSTINNYRRDNHIVGPDYY